MPVPTFDFSLFGTPGSSDYHARKLNFIDNMNTALLQLWNRLNQYGGKFFASRELAVAYGQEELMNELSLVFTREGTTLVMRGSGQSTDDPLFSSFPFWGVIARLPSEASLAAAVSGEVATRIEQAVRTIGTVANFGIDATPAFGAPATSQVYVFASPAVRTGTLTRIRAYVRTAGTLSLRVYSRSLNTWTLVRQQDVVVMEGLNDLPADLDIEKGQYVGVFPGSAVLAYIAGIGPEIYQGADGPSFEDSSQANGMQLQFTATAIYPEKGPDIIDSAALAKVIGATERTIGLAGTPAASGPISVAYNYVLDQPVPDGAVVAFEAAFDIGGVVRVGRYSRSGNVFTRLDYRDVVVEPGLNAIALSMPLNGGEYLGWWANGPRVRYINTTAAVAYFRSDLATEQPSFTGVAGTVELQAKFRVLAAPVGSSANAGVIDDMVMDVSASVSGSVVTVSASVAGPGGIVTPYSGTVNALAAPTGLMRYDLVYLNRLSGAIGIRAGVARTDAENGKPDVAASSEAALAMVRVTDAGISSVTPLAPVRNNLPAITAQAIGETIDDARRRAPRFMGKLRRGAPLHILGFGDSITALQSAAPPSTVPNGALRDRAKGAYLSEYPSDYLATIPTYTAVQLGRADDGAGAVHTRIGWNWSLVSALEAQGYGLGTDLTYDNFGVGGWATSNAWDAETNTPTAWLSSAIALNADLVVLALGMNERGSTATEAQLSSIVAAFRAAGTDVVLVEVPRPLQGGLSSWRYTNAVIRRVADYSGVGYIPLSGISEDGVMQSLGVAPEDVAAANANNHPGPIELSAYGELLARLAQ